MELKFPDEIYYSTEYIETDRDDVEICVYKDGDVEISVADHLLWLTPEQLRAIADFAERMKNENLKD